MKYHQDFFGLINAAMHEMNIVAVALHILHRVTSNSLECFRAVAYSTTMLIRMHLVYLRGNIALDIEFKPHTRMTDLVAVQSSIPLLISVLQIALSQIEDEHGLFHDWEGLRHGYHGSPAADRTTASRSTSGSSVIEAVDTTTTGSAIASGRFHATTSAMSEQERECFVAHAYETRSLSKSAWLAYEAVCASIMLLHKLMVGHLRPVNADDIWAMRYLEPLRPLLLRVLQQRMPRPQWHSSEYWNVICDLIGFWAYQTCESHSPVAQRARQELVDALVHQLLRRCLPEPPPFDLPDGGTWYGAKQIRFGFETVRQLLTTASTPTTRTTASSSVSNSIINLGQGAITIILCSMRELFLPVAPTRAVASARPNTEMLSIDVNVAVCCWLLQYLISAHRMPSNKHELLFERWLIEEALTVLSIMHSQLRSSHADDLSLYATMNATASAILRLVLRDKSKGPAQALAFVGKHLCGSGDVRRLTWTLPVPTTSSNRPSHGHPVDGDVGVSVAEVGSGCASNDDSVAGVK
jgi:hypothetical protein